MVSSLLNGIRRVSPRVSPVMVPQLPGPRWRTGSSSTSGGSASAPGCHPRF